ncbi:hypothetical protein FQA39_LY10419 [Lamprigera yunnana]|nr:hypothetical protein FQA39_LY10419 [Lamprigera yunnana]
MARGDRDLKKYKFKSKLRTTANKAKMRWERIKSDKCDGASNNDTENVVDVEHPISENISKTDLNAESCSFVGRDTLFENQSNTNNFNVAMER